MHVIGTSKSATRSHKAGLPLVCCCVSAPLLARGFRANQQVSRRAAITGSSAMSDAYAQAMGAIFSDIIEAYTPLAAAPSRPLEASRIRSRTAAMPNGLAAVARCCCRTQPPPPHSSTPHTAGAPRTARASRSPCPCASARPRSWRPRSRFRGPTTSARRQPFCLV